MDHYVESSQPPPGEETKSVPRVRYKVYDVPSWYECVLFGFQHYLTMLGSTVVIPLLLVPLMGGNEEDKAKVIQSMFFVSGINTLLQTTIGDRLPIVQGGTFSYLTPAIAIIGKVKADFGDCENGFGPLGFSSAEECDHERFKITMRELQGAIIIVGIIQICLGWLGIVSFMLRFISPIVIGPTVAMVGLSLFGVGFTGVGNCVELGLTQIVTIIIFSQYLRNVRIRGYQVFALFPVLLGIMVTWAFGAILTEAGAYKEPDHACRTDSSDVLEDSAWVYIPHPGQWGRPTFTASSVFSMLAGALAGMIESVGDYYAVANMSGAPPPPPFVIGRGIGAEGVGIIVAGLIGTGNGTTSYSENIGAIGITGVGSRRVVQTGAAVMIVFGILGKFGALFASLPNPMVSGLFCVMFGLIAAVGMSNLQHADMNSPRNLFIVGFGLYMGLSVPVYFEQYEQENGHGPINTGSQEFNDIFNTLFKTSMVVALLSTFILDNTTAGTLEERGLHKWQRLDASKSWLDDEEYARSYALPFGVSRWMDDRIAKPFQRTTEQLGRVLALNRRTREDGV